MDFTIHTFKNHKILEVISEDVVINNLQDALDLLGNSSWNEAYEIIVHKHQLCNDFFDLKTKIAGDILQKFSTYNMKLAIIGNFDNIESKSLRDFIRESNKIGRILFLDSIEVAFEKLTK